MQGLCALFLSISKILLISGLLLCCFFVHPLSKRLVFNA